MHKKILILIFLAFLFQIIKADGEFITIWKPNIPNTVPLINVNAPSQAGPNQIWFPGIGQNYTITWEEVNYPQHNGIMTNVTSTKQVLIDFGAPLNPDFTNAAYSVKVSNGNGSFQQIRFGESQAIFLPDSIFLLWDVFGSADKITEIAQWGDIAWISMNSAFTFCRIMQLTAADTPNLSGVTNASMMFYNAHNFLGAPSMQNWNTSNIRNFSWMFSYNNDYPQAVDQFNFPLGSWNMSSAEDLSYMFSGRKVFNQNLNSWNTSNVKDMKWMFNLCLSYNQPLDNWDTSNVTDMSFMFHFIPVFNQSLAKWNTSNVTSMSHMFHGCTAFNQSLNSWNTSKVTNMNIFLSGSSSFNQSLEDWNLSALTQAGGMLTNTGIDCTNYSKTLWGWANNTNTPNSIDPGSVIPLQYSIDAVNHRNTLINKGWVFNGDTQGACRVTLATSENQLNTISSIYPNPAGNDLHLKNMHNIKSYKILDASGRIIKGDTMNTDIISVSSLTSGNYILQIVLKNKIQSFKFIKK